MEEVKIILKEELRRLQGINKMLEEDELNKYQINGNVLAMCEIAKTLKEII